jgi:hypothetical protein
MRLENNSDNMKERLKYFVPFDFLTIIEFFMGVYCLFCVYVSIMVEKPFIIGFMVIYSLGFFFVSINSIKEALWSVKPSLEKEPAVSIEIA